MSDSPHDRLHEPYGFTVTGGGLVYRPFRPCLSIDPIVPGRLPSCTAGRRGMTAHSVMSPRTSQGEMIAPQWAVKHLEDAEK